MGGARIKTHDALWHFGALHSRVWPHHWHDGARPLHIYTVDEHSLRMMRLLRKLRIENLPQFALATDIASRFKKKEVLYLTALLRHRKKPLLVSTWQTAAKSPASFAASIS